MLHVIPACCSDPVAVSRWHGIRGPGILGILRVVQHRCIETLRFTHTHIHTHTHTHGIEPGFATERIEIREREKEGPEKSNPCFASSRSTDNHIRMTRAAVRGDWVSTFDPTISPYDVNPPFPTRTLRYSNGSNSI